MENWNLDDEKKKQNNKPFWVDFGAKAGLEQKGPQDFMKSNYSG